MVGVVREKQSAFSISLAELLAMVITAYVAVNVSCLLFGSLRAPLRSSPFMRRRTAACAIASHTAAVSNASTTG